MERIEQSNEMVQNSQTVVRGQICQMGQIGLKRKFGVMG